MFGTVTAISAAPDPAPAAAPTALASAPKQMSVGEMNVSIAGIEAKLESDAQDVLHLQEAAKKQKDVIKLNCVNDRMVQLKAQQNIADATRQQLNASLAKNSEDRFGLYAQFQSAAQSVADLREQARACIGEPELRKQESGVTVDRPDVPDDPTVLQPPIIDIEPPGYASPYD